MKKKENELILKNKKNINNKNEIYIGDPNKFNVEMNTELIQTRSLIKKYNHLLQQEKLISHRLKEKIQDLEENIKKINNGILPKNPDPNIEVIYCLLNEDNDDNLDNNYKVIKEKVQDLEENIKKINNGIIPKINDPNIEVIDWLFSEDDDDDLEEDFEVKKEEEQEIQFPDKLKVNKTKTNENNNTVPKLDLSQVLGKYKKPENLKIINAEGKKSHRSGDGEIIDKLNAQIKIFKQTIQRYKDRIKKLREQILLLRNKNKILESTLHNLNQNNNNNKMDESMNVNVSQFGDLNSTCQNTHKNADNKNEEIEDKLENIDIKEESK